MKDGRFGAYVTDGETNATIPKGEDVEAVDYARAVQLSPTSVPRGRSSRRQDAPACAPVGRRPRAEEVTGRFITLEGGDGAARRPRRSCSGVARVHGRTVVRTREPGGTELGVQIRQMVLHGGVTSLPGPRRCCTRPTVPSTSRRSSVRRSRVARSSCRTATSTRPSPTRVSRAGSAPSRSAHVSEWAAEGLAPDLTILLDLDDTSDVPGWQQRSGHLRPARVRGCGVPRVGPSAFLEMAEAEPERFLVVDASDPTDAVRTRSVERSIRASGSTRHDGGH